MLPPLSTNPSTFTLNPHNHVNPSPLGLVNNHPIGLAAQLKQLPRYLEEEEEGEEEDGPFLNHVEEESEEDDSDSDSDENHPPGMPDDEDHHMDDVVFRSKDKNGGGGGGCLGHDQPFLLHATEGERKRQQRKSETEF